MPYSARLSFGTLTVSSRIFSFLLSLSYFILGNLIIFILLTLTFIIDVEPSTLWRIRVIPIVALLG